MKVEILVEGKVFKNHKTMCEELGLLFKNNTNSKKAQLKDLGLYCDWSKSGHSIVVGKVYDVPKLKVENRGKSSGSRGNNNVYGEYIQLLIADMLAKSSHKQFSVSRTKLLNTLNMINKNYGNCKQYVKELSDYTSIDRKVIWDFYNTSNNNFKTVVEGGLNALEDKRVAMYRKILKVYDKTTKSHRDCTREEEDMIQHDIEKEVLKEFPEEFQSMKAIRMSKHWKEFQRKVNLKLNQETDFEYYYHAYYISINKRYIAEERDKLKELVLDEIKRGNFKSILNAQVQDHLYENAEKRHDKSETSTSKMWEVRYDLDYPDKIKMLIGLLIDEETKNILPSLDIKDEMDLYIEEQMSSLDENLFS